MPVVLQLRVHEKDLDLNPDVWYVRNKNYMKEI